MRPVSDSGEEGQVEKGTKRYSGMAEVQFS